MADSEDDFASAESEPEDDAVGKTESREDTIRRDREETGTDGRKKAGMGEGREAAEDEEKEAGVDRRKEAGEMVTDCMRIGGGSEEEGGRVGGGERETFAKSTTAKDHKLPENKDSSTAADLEQTTIVTERDKVRDSEREKDTGPLETVERTSSMTEERQEGQGGVEDGERRGLQRGTEMPPVRREGGGGGGGGGGGRGEEGGMGREGGHGAVGEGATGDEGVRRGDVGDGGGGGEGGWGWGGWGKSLWSSVSTVTGSAQTLGQKVTAAITTVEDVLGLPSPHNLASAKGEEGGGDGEGNTGDGDGDRGTAEREERDAQGDVQTLAKLAERIVGRDVTPWDPGSGSTPITGLQVEPERDQEHGDSATTIGTFSGFFSGIANVVEQRSMQLMSEGLDALENIGKKTMEVLTEGDPGLQKKRRFLKGDAPSLSALLREAKAEAEARQNETEAVGGEDQAPPSYSSLFDEYHGVVYLEALELLSKEHAAKVRGCLPSLTGEEGEWVLQQMELITRALAIKDSEGGLDVLDDDSGRLGEITELFSDLTLPVKVEKLVKVSSFWREKLESMSVSTRREEGLGKETEREGEREGAKGNQDTQSEKSGKETPESEESGKETQCEAFEEKEKRDKPAEKEVYVNGLRGLVEMTSVSIELFRKMAEVSLLPQVTKTDTIGQAEKFNRLTILISNELDALASAHAEVLTDMATTDVNTTITSLYLESSNSVSYVQDALQLLKPVLQYAVLQEVALHQPGPNVHSRT